MTKRGRLALSFTLLWAAGCTAPATHAVAPQYFDIRFPVRKITARAAYPRTIDPSGILWYIDGNEIVRQPRPGRVRVIRDKGARSGNIFWYDNAIFVLTGDGTHFTRVDRRMRTFSIRVPRAYAPLEGAVADATHRAIIAARASPRELTIVDAWRWRNERLPGGIDPFAMTLAGGSRGKKFLVVGDQLSALIIIKDRQSGHAAFVRLPGNTCFAGSPAPLHMPVDVRGRDSYRIWATSGERAVSIDLRTNRLLRTWELPGCAMRILTAGPRGAVVLMGTSSDRGYASSLAKVDVKGVHVLTQYGEIGGLGSGAILDRFNRLWWFDQGANAFVCRTPVS